MYFVLELLLYYVSLYLFRSLCLSFFLYFLLCLFLYVLVR